MFGRTALSAAQVLAVLLVAGTAWTTAKHLPPLFEDRSGWAPPGDTKLSGRAVQDYRLPNSTIPTHYDVVLTTQVDKGIRPFTGEVSIDIEVEEATNSIVIHARQLTITAAKIVDLVTEASEELDHAYEEEREFLTLTRKVETQFSVGSKLRLVVTYEGLLRADNGGFYLSTYTDEDDNTRYLATTQFESTNARHAFPCYDEPDKRATFTITINHSPSYVAISNMPVDEGKSQEGRTVFQQTQSMSTYLVAFIVSDFKYSEGVLNQLPQRIYSRPGTEHEQEWALLSGMVIVERLADYFQIDFMFPKLDQAAIPDFAAGAMENWGLATYREEYMLYDPHKSTINTQTSIANIIAHEYCHQWFGDYVTVKWWTYLWLKEGFATLFTYKAVDAAYPEWGTWQQFHTDDYQSALVADAADNMRPMTHYVQTPNEISASYGTVSYAKAGSVLHMWNHALTEEVFQRGLQIYLQRNQYSAAVEDQLFSALQTAAAEKDYALPDTIANMLGSWSRQGGYPLLTVSRNYLDGSFTVTQEAFYNNETHKSAKTWYVPFNYVVQSNPDFRDTEASHYLLNETKVRINGKIANDDWLILNKQNTGFFRTNYDDRNWNLLIDALINQTYRIHPRNRAQLMHDAYRFSASNRLSHAILLRMLTYLPREDQYAAWSTASGIITTYNRYLSADESYGDFQRYVADLVTSAYDRLGIDDAAGEQHFQKYTRNIVINLACLAGIESCQSGTKDKLSAEVNHNILIEANLQSSIYCNGLRQSEDDVFLSVYNKLMASKDQALRRILINSLGCAQTESQIRTFISSSIDTSNKLRTQERTTLLRPTYSRGQVGLLQCIDFLDQHWQEYADLTADFGGSNPLDVDIRGMSQYVVSREQETRLLQLVEKVKQSNQVTASLEEAVKSNIKSNFDWLERNRGPVMAWLSSYRSGASPSVATAGLCVLVAAAAVLLRHF